MAAGAEFWCDVRDSNPLPADYESAAPPLKLPSHRRSWGKDPALRNDPEGAFEIFLADR